MASFVLIEPGVFKRIENSNQYYYGHNCIGEQSCVICKTMHKTYAITDAALRTEPLTEQEIEEKYNDPPKHLTDTPEGFSSHPITSSGRHTPIPAIVEMHGKTNDGKEYTWMLQAKNSESRNNVIAAYEEFVNEFKNSPEFDLLTTEEQEKLSVNKQGHRLILNFPTVELAEKFVAQVTNSGDCKILRTPDLTEYKRQLNDEEVEPQPEARRLGHN